METGSGQRHCSLSQSTPGLAKKEATVAVPHEEQEAGSKGRRGSGSPVGTAFCSLFMLLSCPTSKKNPHTRYGEMESCVSANLKEAFTLHVLLCSKRSRVCSPLPSRHLCLHTNDAAPSQ